MNRLMPLILLPLLLVACGSDTPSSSAVAATEKSSAAEEYERGPHRGRMLRQGDFALEVTIYETNVPPQFRLYAYQNGKPVPAAGVQATIQLKRLDGEVNNFTFTPENDYLMGSSEVVEPHSFDVEVKAQHAGQSYRWTFQSYEGRTTIPAEAARDAGLKVDMAGPGTIRNTVRLMGAVMLDANRHAEIKARFPGIVRAVNVQEGQRVNRGQTLAVIEGNDSMRAYPVVAPFDGIVLVRNTNVGDVAGSNTLVELADLSSVWVELRALGADAEKLSVGQEVDISSATGEARSPGKSRHYSRWPPDKVS